jgi:hypothetical protein
MAEADKPQEKKLPFVEVLPPQGTENEQPLVTNQFELSGGGVSPFVLDFYYVSINAYRRVFRGGSGENIERINDEHVIYRSPPVARVGLSPLMAVQLIGALYEQLRKDGDASLLERLDTQLNVIREPKVKQERG